MKTLLVGLGLTVVLAVVFHSIWGRVAVLPTVVFGGLATAIQLASGSALRGADALPFGGFVAQYGKGMLYRIGGVILIAVAVVVNRDLFPPLPTAFGYLGVLLPLLFLEWRSFR